MGRVLDKDGNKHSTEETRSKALGKAMTALAMHAHLNAKKIDDKMMPIPQHKIDKHIRDLVDAIGLEPNITLHIGFGLFVAMNPKESHGIPDEFMENAFTAYMKILNTIDNPGDKDG